MDASGENSDPRPYQIELLEASLEENTIVNLGTGAGKTYIAVMLIKELSPPILLSLSDPNAKRSVFLVTTVPLVKQQAGYISLHTRLEVGEYIGDMGVDGWSQERWRHELENHQVLVMTMTIFKNLILHNQLSFSQVNLLIFDECHHAVKNHDYVQIMRRFKGHLDTTRILGLTASLIPSKCKPGDLKKKIETLENTLCCRSQTAQDLQEVARYATNPDESCSVYRSSECDPNVSKLKEILESPLNFLEGFSKEMKEGEFYETVKLNLEDCLHILLNLGIWCAYRFSVDGLEDINRRIIEKNGFYADDWEKILIHLGKTHLEIFSRESKRLSERLGGIHMADKVKKLLIQLGDSAIRCGDVELERRAPTRDSAAKLLGIIFTERRTTAVLLSTLLQQQSKEMEDLRYIKSDYVVGHDSGRSSTYLRKESQMSSKKQEEVLEKFRKGKINLLVSTSVVEEGVDVPKCNMVIRFDFPQNFRSYIQSKGRARAKCSQYILLIPGEDERKLRSQLKDYNELVDELDKICHDRHISDEEEILRQLKDKVEPYTNKDGAKATINSSLSLIYRYCQKLPKDSYTILAPDFKTKKRRIDDAPGELSPYRIPNQIEEFRSTLTFPMSSPVKDPIEGMWFPNKRFADKSAALEAVTLLDQNGELDCHLRPVTKEDDSDEEDEVLSGEKKKPHAGTERRIDYYLNKVAPDLTDCFPICGSNNYLYMFLLSESTTGIIHLSLPDQIEQLSFGILTSKALPQLEIPEYSIYDDDKELHVTIIKYHSTVSIDANELDILKRSHAAIFNDVLKIRPSWLKCNFDSAEKNYLVVPIHILRITDPVETYIKFDLAELIANIKSSKPVAWPRSIDELNNAIVMRQYDPINLYEVREVSRDINISSPFCGSEDQTYKDYFTTKYGCTISDDSQPALICKSLAVSSARLQLLKSRFKNPDGTDTKKSDHRGRTIELFPEICSLYPLPANLWKLAHCIPSILWRVECILSVSVLRMHIASETRIGMLPDGTEITTCINFRGYKDLAYGNLQTKRCTPEPFGEKHIYFYDPLGSYIRGPDSVLLLQALTTKSAGDAIDLERLETLGDSFLKFSTTVFLYSDRLSAHEGKLSQARSRRVGNFNLYYLAKQRGIANTIFSSTFDPRQMWTPPCFTFVDKDPHLTNSNPPSSQDDTRDSSSCHIMSDQEKHYLYHKLTDKGVADCVESLIGAYLVSGGIKAGLKFMIWMGIKICSDRDDASMLESGEYEEEEMKTSSSSCFNESYASAPCAKHIKISSCDPSLFIQNSASILVSFFPPNPVHKFNQQQEVERERLLNISCGKEDILQWQFKDRSLLLQAVTHASYTKNRLTECYQRLEFLGDAVLDYLVTCHIYLAFPDYGPGDISNMRSALVNNITFAELAVELKLHKALLYNSPSLYKQIESYLKAVEKYSKEEADECSLFLCESKDLARECDETCESDASVELVDDMDPPKVLGDILESLAGAIFIDSGMCLESVWNIFQPLFDTKIKSFKGIVPIGPIQELFQLNPLAKTENIKEGPKRVKCIITVLHNGTPLRVAAIGSTNKAAKNTAAKALLKKMRNMSQS